MLRYNKFVYIFTGNILPLLVGFLSVPFSLKYFGVEVVGFISICWLFFGYSGIFDLGLSRSMTQMISKLLPYKDYKLISKFFWTTFIVSMLLSILITLLIYFFSTEIVSLFKISNKLLNNSIKSFEILSFSVPFIILSSVLIGFLTAFNSFKKINYVKIPIGILMMLAPVISYFLDTGIIGIIYIILISRFFLFFIYLIIIFKEYPFVRKIEFGFYGLKELLNQGLWMTLSNIISPLIVNFDRFILGSLISVQAVAYYSTVYDVVSKLNIIPSTFVTVLFPIFAYNSSINESKINSNIMGKYMIVVLLIISPIIFLTQIWSYNLIEIWINPYFAIKSYKITMLLLIGIFWNCLSQIPFTYLQANGKASKTALFHITELILFLPILYFSIITYGIIGAAFAWASRVFIDFVLLYYYSYKLFNTMIEKSIILIQIIISICLIIIFFIDLTNNYLKGLLTVIMAILYIFIFNNYKYLFNGIKNK